MSNEEIIEFIKSKKGAFSTSEIINDLGGSKLSVIEKANILSILYDLTAAGSVIHREINGSFFYEIINIKTLNKK